MFQKVSTEIIINHVGYSRKKKKDKKQRGREMRAFVCEREIRLDLNK